MAQQEKDPGLRVSDTTNGEPTAPVYETMTVERKQPISIQSALNWRHSKEKGNDFLGEAKRRPLSLECKKE